MYMYASYRNAFFLIESVLHKNLEKKQKQDFTSRVLTYWLQKVFGTRKIEIFLKRRRFLDSASYNEMLQKSS